MFSVPHLFPDWKMLRFSRCWAAALTCRSLGSAASTSKRSFSCTAWGEWPRSCLSSPSWKDLEGLIVNAWNRRVQRLGKMAMIWFQTNLSDNGGASEYGESWADNLHQYRNWSSASEWRETLLKLDMEAWKTALGLITYFWNIWNNAWYWYFMHIHMYI